MRIKNRTSALVVVLFAAPMMVGSALQARAADIPPPANPAAIGAPSAGDKGDGLAAAEKKLPDSVKDVLKRLDKPAEDVTLDDLNSARQAVAKVEIMIELEKRLVELEKVKHERDKESNTFMPMIPASALQMPAPIMPSAAVAPPQMMAPMARDMEVTQISGGSGHYSAIIKVGGEEAKTFRVGDKLSDGSEVREILPTQAVLDRNGTNRTLHVKNVDMVFGNSF